MEGFASEKEMVQGYVNKFSNYTDVFGASMYEQMSSRLVAIQNLEILNETLDRDGLIATEVPADGNCGVWSLLSFQKGAPLLEFKDKKARKECQGLRDRIADCLEKASTEMMWKGIYQNLVHCFENKESQPKPPQQKAQPKPPQPEAQPDSHPEPHVKIEGGSKKAKPRPTEYIDLLTPPRESKALKVATIGEQRPAFAKKRAETLPVPQAPQDDKENSPAAEAEEPSEPRKKRRKMKVAVEKALKTSEKVSAKGKQSKAKDPEKDQEDVEKEEGKEDKQQERKRKRTCKSKKKSTAEEKLNVVKIYLASKGITWQSCQSYHSRYSVDASAKCKEYKSLQNNLVSNEMPKCTTCLAMLKQYRIDLDQLKELLVKIDEIPDDGAERPKAAKMVGVMELEEESDVEINVAEGEQSLVAMGTPPSASPTSSDQWQIVLWDPDIAATAQVNQSKEDVASYLRRRPYLQLLPASGSKRLPIRCKVCKSAKQPDGKIFEGHEYKLAIIKHFVGQHCDGATHIANMAKRAARQQIDAPEVADGSRDPIAMVACTGQSLTSHIDERMNLFKSELVEWARSTKLAKSLKRHTYTFNASAEDLTVKHESCSQVVVKPLNDDQRPMCENCADPRLGHQALKSAIRFALKHWAARILESRLFKSDEHVEMTLRAFRNTHLYRTQEAKSEELVNLSNDRLQAWVRNSWMKVPRDCCTDSLLGKI